MHQDLHCPKSDSQVWTERRPGKQLLCRVQGPDAYNIVKVAPPIEKTLPCVHKNTTWLRHQRRTSNVLQAEGDCSLDLLFFLQSAMLSGSSNGDRGVRRRQRLLIFAPVRQFAAEFEARREAPELLALQHAFAPVAGFLGHVYIGCRRRLHRKRGIASRIKPFVDTPSRSSAMQNATCKHP